MKNPPACFGNGKKCLSKTFSRQKIYFFSSLFSVFNFCLGGITTRFQFYDLERRNLKEEGKKNYFAKLNIVKFSWHEEESFFVSIPSLNRSQLSNLINKYLRSFSERHREKRRKEKKTVYENKRDCFKRQSYWFSLKLFSFFLFFPTLLSLLLHHLGFHLVLFIFSQVIFSSSFVGCLCTNHKIYVCR